MKFLKFIKLRNWKLPSSQMKILKIILDNLDVESHGNKRKKLY